LKARVQHEDDGAPDERGPEGSVGVRGGSLDEHEPVSGANVAVRREDPPALRPSATGRPGRGRGPERSPISLNKLVFVERAAADAYAPLRAPLVRSAVIFVLDSGFQFWRAFSSRGEWSRPIRVLQEGAARIGAGDLGYRIEVRTGDELEVLGDELNRMGTQLQESYGGLEEKVGARTRELAAAVDELKGLSEVSQTVSSTLDLGAVLTRVVSHACS